MSQNFTARHEGETIVYTGGICNCGKKRQPHNGKPVPDIFTEISDVTQAPDAIVGRNRLVLKARNTEELMYYTTDNE